MNNPSFYEISYQIHEKSYSEVDKQKEIELYKNWFNNNTVDIWRHLRMLDFLDIFIDLFPSAKWLTVGDGRFGTSAIYIGRKGSNVLPSDIDVSLLKIAKEQAMIKDYCYANAEKLPFDKDAFDFTFCKEAYHHFPRAYLALYEMLRVSSTAVMLTEPRDWLPSPVPRRLLQAAKHFIKNISGQKPSHPDAGNYEPVGNYVFTISEREFQKIASGLNLPAVAFKSFHDVYLEGVEKEKINSNGPLFKKIKKKIMINRLLRLFGIEKTNRIIAILFKKSISETLRGKLETSGFTIIDLPKNPYVAE